MPPASETLRLLLLVQCCDFSGIAQFTGEMAARRSSEARQLRNMATCYIAARSN